MLIEHEGRRPHVDPLIATGAALFPGARGGAGAEVRIHGVVHVNTVHRGDRVLPEE